MNIAACLFAGDTLSSQQVREALGSTITNDRLQAMQSVCASRTFQVLPVVEGLYDMGNVGAVCRSADGKL